VIQVHEHEHCEVEVQHQTGVWHTDTSGPRVLYPDLESATTWAVKLQGIHGTEKVRIKHVMADYYAPELLATT
jgi:hypothetical protein